MRKTEHAILDKSMIENFADVYDDSGVQDAAYVLQDIVDNVTLLLSDQNRLLNLRNVDLVMFGDYATNTNIANSDLNFYLMVRSGQIELNTIKDMTSFRKSVLSKVKMAWRRVKANKRRIFSRKKKKLRKEVLTESDLREKKDKPYTIFDLKDDYFNLIVSSLSNLSVIYNYQNKITILSKEELGFRINIIPAFMHDEELRIWNFKTNKLKSIMLDDALEMINNKNEEINKLNYSQNNKNNLISFHNSHSENDVYKRVVRIYKTLANSIWQTTEFSFIDSLLFNCPNEIFVGSTYDVFLKTINYLLNAHIENFMSVYNQNKTLYIQDEISIIEVKNFLKQISKMITNNENL